MTAQIFQFPNNGTKLRQIVIDGEPWFVGADVCRCLDLGMAKGSYLHLKKLDADEKQCIRKSGGSLIWQGDLFLGTESQHLVVSESGLYKLVMRCDKPIAREFQNWLAREVLPAIRKTGGYLLNEDMRETAVADQRDEFPMPVSFPRRVNLAVRQHAHSCPQRPVGTVRALGNMMTRLTIFALCMPLLAVPALSWAHGGGLNAEGCHNNRKTGDYHCHGGGGGGSSASRLSGRSRAVGFLGGGGGGSFANCSAARAAGAAPVRRGDAGYGSHLDRDGDGVGCE